VLRELTLSWGVFPVLTEKYKNTQAVLHKVDNFVKKSPLFKKKDKVVIATGSFDKAHRMSNLIKITEV